jgi:hypothetical protein
MKGQTERFLERASRSSFDARQAYERLVRRLHHVGTHQATVDRGVRLDEYLQT